MESNGDTAGKMFCRIVGAAACTVITHRKEHAVTGWELGGKFHEWLFGIPANSNHRPNGRDEAA